MDIIQTSLLLVIHMTTVWTVPFTHDKEKVSFANLVCLSDLTKLTSKLVSRTPETPIMIACAELFQWPINILVAD